MKKAFTKFNKADKNNFNFATLLGFDFCTFCSCHCDMAYKPASSYTQNAIEDAGF